MTEAPSEPEMSWAQVLDLVSRLDSSDYADVELEMPGLRLRMSTTALPAAGVVAPSSETHPTAAVAPTPATAAASAPAPPTAAPATAVGESGPAGSANLVEVTAPMLGTFYCRPSPDKDPYVAVGAQVAADTTVGIVEVMKLMNQVAAGTLGTVVEVLAADGDLVEHGQVLVRIDAGAGS